MLYLKKNIAVSDSGFIFDPSTGDSYSANPIGLEIIKMLKDGKSENDVKNFIKTTYNTDEATVESDLTDFLSVLQKNKLVEKEK